MDEILPAWTGGRTDPPRAVEADADRTESGAIYEGRGWPMISLWCRRPRWPDRGPPGAFNPDLTKMSGAIRISFLDPWTVPSDPTYRYSRAIPYRPRPLGFLVNTLFYAMILGVLGVLGLGPIMLVRWHRIRRGRCPKCGYPAGSSDVCTECGKQLPERLVHQP
jgi:hypothetical protein